MLTSKHLHHLNFKINIKFEGNAPNDYVSGLQDMPEYTVYYHEGAEGFTSPDWSGYLTKIW